ncbi:MAG: PKD domain-containing protein, partial [Bacteroidota bacterium]
GTITIIDNLGNIVSYLLENPYILPQPILYNTGFFENLCEGVYSLTMTDINGCLESLEITVGVDNLVPQITISVLPDCYYIGNPVAFNATVIDMPASGTISWNFGDPNDPTPGTGLNPSHTYTEYGYYCVTATITSCCGNVTSNSLYIFVYPDECACGIPPASNFTYDYPENYPSITGNVMINNQNGTLAFETVEGDLIVENGANLTINNAVIRFGPKGRILVKPGGTLYIVSSLLTNLPDPCHQYMWMGVEVHGYENLDSDDPDQGKVFIRNSTIEHAHIGVLLGARDMDAICNFSTNLVNNFDPNLSGGVVRFDGTDDPDNYFIKNGVDVAFMPKSNPEAGYNLIRNALFTGISGTDYYLLDDRYNTSSANPYPNSLNPWTAPANSYQISHSGVIAMNQSFGIFNPITNCEFNAKWHGIQLKSSKINVTYSEFDHTRYGIRIDEVFPGINAHKIENCQFIDIAGVINLPGFGVGIFGGAYDQVRYNSFQNTDTDPNLYEFGMKLRNTTNFNISENSYLRNGTGILLRDGLNGWIGADNPSWLGNEFRDCRQGIVTSGNNSVVALKCNDHYHNSGTYWDTWNNSGVLAGQGQAFFSQNQTPGVHSPAGNWFQDPSFKLLISSNPYFYVHHYTNATPTNQYRPDPVSPVIFRLPTSWAYVGDQQCCQVSFPVPTYLSSFSTTVYPYSALNDLRLDRANLVTEMDNMIANLDEGETELLLNSIQTASQGNLKNLLISHSPLSDTVIYSLMYEDALSSGNFKNVMERNLPVSSAIAGDFVTYIENMPPGIKNQLENLQAMNSLYTTIETLNRTISQLDINYYKLLNDIVVTLTDTNNNRFDDAIQVLEYDNSLHSKQLLFGAYLSNGDFTLAAQKLNELQGTSPDNDDFVLLNQMLLSYFSQGKTVFEIDCADFALVYNMAVRCPENPAIYYAKSIVYIITGEDIPDCPDNLTGKSMMVQASGNEGIDNEEMFLGKNYPDPFTNETRIPYNITGEISGKFFIKDLLGRIVEEIDVLPGRGEIIINSSYMSNGIYLYSLQVNEIIIGSNKMILKN